MRDFGYFAPKNLGEAMSLLQRYGAEARVLAGGTDLFLNLERKLFVPKFIVDLKKIEGLKRIDASVDGLRIGALALMDEIACHPLIQDRWRILADAAAVVGSAQTRNRATLGGNLCNASPAADTATPLLALGARVRIVGGRGAREVLLEEFFIGPRKNCLEPDEILEELTVPLPPPNNGSSFQRRTRTAMDIALVNCAVFLTLSGAGDSIDAVRIALGAVAPIPIRALDAEGILRGEEPTIGRIVEAASRAALSARPIDDVRSSGAYRRDMVRVLTRWAIEEALQRAASKAQT